MSLTNLIPWFWEIAFDASLGTSQRFAKQWRESNPWPFAKQLCWTLSFDTKVEHLHSNMIVFRMIHFAFESINRIIETCKPSRKPLVKIRSRRMLSLAWIVGLCIVQPCNFWFKFDSISNRSVTNLRGRILDTNKLTSVNEATDAVSHSMHYLG